MACEVGEVCVCCLFLVLLVSLRSISGSRQVGEWERAIFPQRLSVYLRFLVIFVCIDRVWRARL